jgi:hypothetical protein
MKTIVLCDSSDFVSFQRFENSILSALDFYQFWYQVIDISYTLIDTIELEDVNLLIIAQEATAKKLGISDWRTIFKKVSSGMGLVIFDGMIPSYQETISQYTGISEFRIEKTIEILLEESWITDLSAEKTIKTSIPVLVNTPEEISDDWHIFLKDHKHHPVGLWKNFGRGKISIIGISQGLWHKNCLGHTNGFDGVFWRTLVFTAKKPFVFKPVPPFITCRVNDATGNYLPENPAHSFKYVSILNQAGFTPHIGLCINKITPDKISHIHSFYHQSKAEFSAHSFTDDLQGNDPSIYMGSDGREFSFEQLKSHFEQVDNFFEKLDIKPAKTINAHRSQISYNAISFFKQRNQIFSMNLLKSGKIYSDPRALLWEPKPYGIQNFSIDFLDENQNIFNGVSHPGKITNKGADIDFLENSASLSQHLLSQRGIFQIKRGIENLFFGCLMFHERNLAKLSMDDFEKIISFVSDEIKRFPHIFRSYDFVMAYLKNRNDSKIAKMKYSNQHLFITISGKSIMPQFLFCFLEDGTKIFQSFLEIPPFEKLLELTYKLPY